MTAPTIKKDRNGGEIMNKSFIFNASCKLYDFLIFSVLNNTTIKP